MKIAQRLRRLLRPPGDLTNDLPVRPLSEAFGYDRGTPIDRFYIDRFLRDRQARIRGRVLEVAGNEYTEKFGSGAVQSMELYTQETSRPGGFTGDLTDMATLPASKVDCFICTQTFNFIYDFKAAIRGAHHLLAAGGTLLATVGGVSQISRFDMDRWGDYWRFTSASCERTFGEFFAEVEVVTFGNLLAATAMIRGLAVEDLPSPEVLEPSDNNYQVIVGIAARKST